MHHADYLLPLGQHSRVILQLQLHVRHRRRGGDLDSYLSLIEREHQVERRHARRCAARLECHSHRALLLLRALEGHGNGACELVLLIAAARRRHQPGRSGKRGEAGGPARPLAVAVASSVAPTGLIRDSRYRPVKFSLTNRLFAQCRERNAAAGSYC